MSSYLLLTRLFLKQFLENDLLSPDSDRSQLLAIAGASLISLTLFISMFMSAPYAMSILMPAHAAVLTLNDKFFYCSLAMLATALAAAAQWDALSLDQRDAAILQPLPVRNGTLRAAKLTAVALLGAAVALAVNAFPTWVFPWMVSFAVPQMTVVQLFSLMVTHALITVTAAVFGFLVVIALRESVSALLGPRLFIRVSPTLQTATIMALGVALLLLPLTSPRTVQRGFSGWRLELPSIAFVGAYETATGGFLAELPRRAMTPAQASRQPLFGPLMTRAQLWLGGVTLIVVAATGLNALRGFAGGTLAPPRRKRSRFAGLAGAVFSSSAASRAGFDFGVATLWRSKTHRLTLACAGAIGLAMVLVSMPRIDLASEGVPARLLAIQPLLYGSLLAGFRHLVRVPAELRANWGVQIAWRGQVREFAAGVQMAAYLTLAVPAVLVTLPPVAVAGGLPFAIAHAVLGLLGAAIFLEALMLSYEKVPFTCSYVPVESSKAMMPIYAGMFLFGATMFARLELNILTGARTIVGLIGLVMLLVSLKVMASRRRRLADVDFNEGPETYQRLGLHS
jgi:hypothetical protein